jgi:hypothetical protein
MLASLSATKPREAFLARPWSHLGLVALLRTLDFVDL